MEQCAYGGHHRNQTKGTEATHNPEYDLAFHMCCVIITEASSCNYHNSRNRSGSVRNASSHQRYHDAFVTCQNIGSVSNKQICRALDPPQLFPRKDEGTRGVAEKEEGRGARKVTKFISHSCPYSPRGKERVSRLVALSCW